MCDGVIVRTGSIFALCCVQGDATDASALMQQQQQQQQTSRPPNLRQGPIRKVTMANPMGQQIQGLGMPQAAPQGGRGGMGNPQQNRVRLDTGGGSEFGLN